SYQVSAHSTITWTISSLSQMHLDELAQLPKELDLIDTQTTPFATATSTSSVSARAHGQQWSCRRCIDNRSAPAAPPLRRRCRPARRSGTGRRRFHIG